MTDPFDALREPVVPTDPDPDFAASLRARIERALALPRGVAVTSTIVEQPQTAALGAAIPYLAVPVGSGRRALDWYVEVLDARLVGEPIMMDDGRVGHAELALSGGTLYLSEEFPEIGVVAPSPAGTPVSLSLQVPDVAETMRRAIAGAARCHGPCTTTTAAATPRSSTRSATAGCCTPRWTCCRRPIGRATSATPG